MNEHSDELDQSDDALSADVRAFLARAERSHQVPDPAVKQRVRAAVGVALIAAPLGAAPAALHELASATKLAARWSLSAKLGVAAVAATLAGTGGWLLPSWYESSAVRSARSVSAPPASADTESGSTGKVAPSLDRSRAEDPRASTERAPSAPVVAVAPSALAEGLPLPPVVSTPLPTENGVVGSADLSPVGHSANQPAAEAAGVVERSELALLMAASEALDARDAVRGLALLAQHRDRFPGSALEQERQGLGLVARCLHDGYADPRLGREARTFLRRFPSAVLTSRIRRACGL